MGEISEKECYKTVSEIREEMIKLNRETKSSLREELATKVNYRWFNTLIVVAMAALGFMTYQIRLVSAQVYDQLRITSQISTDVTWLKHEIDSIEFDGK